jgi:phage regulator Rha-like protein
MNALTSTTNQTMTSREIADLVESNHSDVKRSIERLAKREVIVEPPTADIPFVDASGRNRTESVYLIGQRDSYIIVAQLSPEFTARLVDRWQELEATAAKPALPDFTNPAEAARAWAAEYEGKARALAQLEEAKPAIEFHERVAVAEDAHSIDEAAKILRVKPRAFRQWLKLTINLFRLDGIPRQDFIDRGYVRVIEKTVQLPHGWKLYAQTFITGKGMQFLQRKLDHTLLGVEV